MLTIQNTCNDYIKTCGFPLKLVINKENIACIFTMEKIIDFTLDFCTNL